MELGIRGKTAWVGGASRGLGLAICERLAQEGANLVMVSRGADELIVASERIADEYGIETLFDLVLSCGREGCHGAPMKRLGHTDNAISFFFTLVMEILTA